MIFSEFGTTMVIEDLQSVLSSDQYLATLDVNGLINYRSQAHTVLMMLHRTEPLCEEVNRIHAEFQQLIDQRNQAKDSSSEPLSA